MSKQGPIPFTPTQESGWDIVGGASPAAVNVVVDGRGAVRRRPGVKKYSGAQSSALEAGDILGLYSTSTGDRVYAVAGLAPGAVRLYRVTPDESSLVYSTTATTRPIWAETEAMVLWADSRSINRVLLEDSSIERLPNSPVASHVVALGARLLATDGDQPSQVAYSGNNLGTETTGGHEQWGVQTTLAFGESGFFTAEARPDPVVAIAENSNEVFVLGATTFQTFAADSTLNFAPVSTREHGCAASHSVVRDDQSFAWLDHRRRIVHTDGRSIQVLSSPIQETLDRMARVDDCHGYRITHEPVDALLWNFPTDGRTFCWQKGGGWSIWMGWNESTNNFKNCPITAKADIVGENANLVGLTTGGSSRIGVIDQGTTTDFGERIPAHIETGFIDRGTPNRKMCIAVSIRMRRGHVTGTSEPIAHLSWREGEGPYLTLAASQFSGSQVAW